MREKLARIINVTMSLFRMSLTGISYSRLKPKISIVNPNLAGGKLRMSKHHHHHHRHDRNCKCSKRRPGESRNTRAGENWIDCLCGGSNGTFSIFLLVLILAFSFMGPGGI